jgi:hypothetical protein
MRVLKNLLGDNSKIHADEIAVKPDILLGETVIEEVGSNSNGYWIKWGNGFAICWREITFNRDTTNGQSGVSKPIAFRDDLPLFGGNPSTKMDSWVDRQSLSHIIVSNYPDSWTWAIEYNITDWFGNGDFTFTLWSAGFVD